MRPDVIPSYATPAAPDPGGGSALGMQPDADETYRISVSRAGTGMLVQVLLNGSTRAPFLIDTGASDVLVPKSVADRLGLQVGPNTRTKRYSTANGVVTHPVVMLRSIALGGAVVENVPASISPNLQFGLLGLSFFNHFTYNIDAAQGVVTLKPNRLAEAGGIRGGRSEAQWRSEYRNLRVRIANIGAEKARTPSAHTREHRRLEARAADLERERKLLEGEADQSRVPMAWRY
jgi:clan AA aspartic protease (TIGR02281 family)